MPDQQPTNFTHTLHQKLDIAFALQAAGLGVWELNPVTNTFTWDDQYCQLFGFADTNQLAYQQTLECIHPDDVERVGGALQWAMNPQSDGFYEQTCRISGADGKLRWGRFQGRSYFDEGGRVVRLAGIAHEVTQQIEARQREETAQQQAQRLRHIYEAITASTPDLMYVFNLQYRFTYANRALLEMWGRSWENSIGKSFLELGYEPWHAQMHEQELAQVVATKETIRGEVAFPHATLGQRVYDYLFAPVLNERGEVIALAGTARDITDIRQAQLLLQQSETRFRALIEESPVATGLYVGTDLRIEVANATLLSYWGKSYEVVGLPYREAMPELVGQGFFEKLDAVFATGKPYQQLEAPAQLTIDGRQHTYYFDYSFKPLLTPTGDVYAILNTALDVTDRVVARRQVEETQRQLLSLFEQSPVALAIYSADEEFVIQWANPFFGELVARPPGAIVGKPLLEALPELKGQGFDDILKTVIATNTPFSAYEVAVTILRDEQLTPLFVNLTYQPHRGGDGAVKGILVVATDVTQQVATRRKVEENEAQLRSIIDLTELGIYTIDLRANQLIKSPRLAHWYGLPEVTDVATSFSVIQESDRERVGKVLTDALGNGATGYYNVEYGVIHALTGQQRVLRTTGRVVYDLVGQPVRIDGSVLDVTSQRALQLSLENQVQQRTQELAALNEQLGATNQELVETNHLLARSNENLQTFAYVASHDLQEPLRKVVAFSDLLKTRYADSSGDELMYLERMQSAAQRMSMLIKDLLNYSRLSTQRDNSGRVSLDKIVQQVLTTLEMTIQETGAQLTVDALPDVLGDASQLGQLFQNLLSNALKFRRPKVVPCIAIRANWLAADHLPEGITPGRRAAAYYRIDVSDNGVGFDEKYLDRIFEVFQRLHGKSEFMGTGIGLAICEKVVANHGGAITASSQPNQGATFHVYLPA